jgi:hypothetical protein
MCTGSNHTPSIFLQFPLQAANEVGGQSCFFAPYHEGGFLPWVTELMCEMMTQFCWTMQAYVLGVWLASLTGVDWRVASSSEANARGSGFVR